MKSDYGLKMGKIDKAAEKCFKSEVNMDFQRSFSIHDSGR